ncbi:MAG TPA: P-type conjugative transfer protein VirB9 [Caulobacteraceae bacterium]|nr:P-type conjugative transfer protein VirB9 [Caulobacteraceae bacterium]
MIMVLRLIVAVALLFWSREGFAAVAPEPGAGDPRIQVVRYVPEEVIELRGTVGFITTIQFGDGEHLENIAIGNSLGWQVTPNKRADLLFVKPLPKHPTTNMTVITNLRRYDFRLKAEEASASRPPVYGLRFLYPAPEVPEAVVVLKPAPPPAPEPPRAENSRYTYQGSRDLIPSRVFDDGQFTYFEFPKDADYPAIYRVGADRKESLINFSVRQGFIVVDKVSPGFVLRRGTLEAKIFNDGFKGPTVSAVTAKSKSRSWF